MSGETLTGQDAPVVANEAQNPAPEPLGNPGSTEAQTDGADGGEESPAQQPAKTFTQEEVNAIVAREKAREARRALRDLQRQQPQAPMHSPQQASEEQPQQSQQPRVTQADVEAYLSQQRAQESLSTFLEKAEDAVERLPDYMTVVTDPRLPFNEEMIGFFADSEVGTDLAYHLAKNPEKAFAIARMKPLLAGRELTKLETELKSRPKAQPSKAPEPIRPVGNRGSSTASALPSDDDPTDVWMEKERKRTASR